MTDFQKAHQLGQRTIEIVQNPAHWHEVLLNLQMDMHPETGIGELVMGFRDVFFRKELEFWIELFQEEIADSPELASTETPSRQDLVVACDTLLKFFK